MTIDIHIFDRGGAFGHWRGTLDLTARRAAEDVAEAGGLRDVDVTVHPADRGAGGDFVAAEDLGPRNAGVVVNVAHLDGQAVAPRFYREMVTVLALCLRRGRKSEHSVAEHVTRAGLAALAADGLAGGADRPDPSEGDLDAYAGRRSEPAAAHRDWLTDAAPRLGPHLIARALDRLGLDPFAAMAHDADTLLADLPAGGSFPAQSNPEPHMHSPQIVRYGELIPCRTAFIDAHTPGSNQKENFTIIGGGVSEAADQHVHITDTIGFNIGAAGQPPRVRNSLHSHRTAEVFFVASGRWRFFWGRWGDAGEVVLEEGDIIDIPTGIFRGFENIGSDYGMIMAILGGDDAGGGVIWAPQVIEEAKDHGLVLGANGKLYDTKKGEALPEGVGPMRTLTDEELADYPEPTPMEVVGGYVRRYWDMAALGKDAPVKVIGETGIIRDRPGFEVDLLTRGGATETPHTHDRPSVLMPVRGHWRLQWDGGEAILSAGDTALVPGGLDHAATPSMTGEAALYHIVATDDPAGPTRRG